ncbi:MAG: Transposase domain protein [Gemmataceae bacterium]|nr:Transposase domain protein [Gemmataceae bacterium]
MLMDAVIDRFIQRTPMAVAVRGTLEYALAPEPLDALFEELVGERADRQLLFSTCVDLMACVVNRVNRSVLASYRAAEDLPVYVSAVYQRLQRMPLEAARQLVRHTAARLEPVIRAMNGAAADRLPGYRVKILDGNHLTRTQRRVKALREVAAGPLPGQALVVLDPALGLALDVIGCEDAHAQERSLLAPVLETVRPKDVWVDDRNFCTTDFLFGISTREGYFITRRHASTLSWEEESPWVAAGRTDTGVVDEQALVLLGPRTSHLRVRHIRLTLDQPTQDGDTFIEVVTNLPAEAAGAATVAELYRDRWRVEGLFHRLTVVLQCEVNALGYPPAALFGFCVALASSNAYAAVRAAVRAEHGAEAAEEVSEYYVSAELERTVEGMAVAVPEENWAPIAGWSAEQMGAWLRAVVRPMKPERYKKATRGPKKNKPRRTRFASKKHIATARLLKSEQK